MQKVTKRKTSFLSFVLLGAFCNVDVIINNNNINLNNNIIYTPYLYSSPRSIRYQNTPQMTNDKKDTLSVRD